MNINITKIILNFKEKQYWINNLFFYLKWFFFLLYANTFFKLERLIYIFINKICNKKLKTRLFLSSGNISLINILTFLTQYPEDNTEDILVIDSVLGTKDFYEINKKIAMLHNFKKVYCIQNQRTLPFILKNNLFGIDEIYAHTKLDYMRFLIPLFKDCKFHIFDEGIASLIEQYHPNNKYINDIITMNYCDKFDKLGFENIPIRTLDKDIFLQIANNINEQYPFDIKISQDAKVIMFCSAYWNSFNMGKEAFYNYQNSILHKLINNGFTVIYKQHPREVEDIEIPYGVIKTKSLLPLEIYNIDVLAIVSIASTVSLHPYHYWNIPGFVSINAETIKTDGLNFITIVRKMLAKYIPDVSELLKLSANDYSKEDLKKHLKEIMNIKLNSQNKLSENKILLDEFRIFKKQEENKFDKKW